MKGTVLRVTPSVRRKAQSKPSIVAVWWWGVKPCLPDERVLRFIIALDTKNVEVEDRASADNESIIVGDPVTVGKGYGVGNLLYCPVRLDVAALRREPEATSS